MQIWTTLILALQLLAALAMIGLVLIQHGKGADMGASFGSGASGSLFGASGSANFLSRSTAACAAVFFACTLALAFISNGAPRARAGRQRARPRRARGQRACPAAAIPGGQRRRPSRCRRAAASVPAGRRSSRRRPRCGARRRRDEPGQNGAIAARISSCSGVMSSRDPDRRVAVRADVVKLVDTLS